MRDFALSLGSNLNDRLAILRDAVTDLVADRDLEITGVSSVYETAPVGGPEQGDYLNAVVIGRTALEPEELLARTQKIETGHGRTRDVRWGPRTLDIDILVLGDLVLDSAALVLPHPRAHLRAFVLVPWADVDPTGVIPGIGPVATLASSIDVSGVVLTSLTLDGPL